MLIRHSLHWVCVTWRVLVEAGLSTPPTQAASVALTLVSRPCLFSLGLLHTGYRSLYRPLLTQEEDNGTSSTGLGRWAENLCVWISHVNEFTQYLDQSLLNQSFLFLLPSCVCSAFLLSEPVCYSINTLSLYFVQAWCKPLPLQEAPHPDPVSQSASTSLCLQELR